MTDEDDIDQEEITRLFKVNPDGETVSFTIEQTGILLSLIADAATLSISGATLSHAYANEDEEQISEISETVKDTANRLLSKLKKLTNYREPSDE